MTTDEPNEFGQTRPEELSSKIDLLSGQLANADNRLENQSALITDTYLNIEKLASQLAAAQTQINTMQNILETMGDQSLSQRLSALETAALSASRIQTLDAPAPPQEVRSTKSWPDLLRTEYPGIYGEWKRLFDHGMASYDESVESSCSTWDNRFAVAFRDYVTVFATGHLLDIGSGTLKRPVYLEGYPVEMLHGIDPRECTVKPDFKIVCGVNEFLPWKDESFQTAVNATSLDHVIDLDRSLAETARILAPKGRFILWYAHIDGAEMPPSVAGAESETVSGIDEYHLFHFNDEWFIPKLEKHFSLLDRRVYPIGGFSHVFAVYEK